jgi:16S rRNA (cytidine1402-2'-O)-methyltransferase
LHDKTFCLTKEQYYLKNYKMSTPARQSGTLVFASNSLGVPEQIPAQSLEAVTRADVLVFEEDKIARKVLKQAGIHRNYLKYNEHKSPQALEEIREALSSGKTVCYMSDCGVPNLADPGKELLETAYGLGCALKIIPGPSSISLALAACPFSVEKFRYAGFLPKDRTLREEELALYAEGTEAVVILETPYRLKNLLESCVATFGDSRRALLALDIAGTEEEYMADSLAAILAKVAAREQRTNFVLVVSGIVKVGNPVNRIKRLNDDRAKGNKRNRNQHAPKAKPIRKRYD